MLDHMENDANNIWNESLILDLTHLYSCVAFAKASSNRSVVKQGEATEANDITFNSLLEKSRDLLLLAGYSVLITERKNGGGKFRKCFLKESAGYIYSNQNENEKSVSLD